MYEFEVNITINFQSFFKNVKMRGKEQRHDNQHNSTLHNDYKHNDAQHNIKYKTPSIKTLDAECSI